MKGPDLKISFLLFCVSSLILGCFGTESDNLAGGVTETTNGNVVSGMVVDAAGRTVPGTGIRLWPTEALLKDSALAFRAVTDDSGRYRIQEVPAGYYRLDVQTGTGEMVHRRIRVPALFAWDADPESLSDTLVPPVLVLGRLRGRTEAGSIEVFGMGRRAQVLDSGAFRFLLPPGEYLLALVENGRMQPLRKAGFQAPKNIDTIHVLPERAAGCSDLACDTEAALEVLRANSLPDSVLDSRITVALQRLVGLDFSGLDLDSLPETVGNLSALETLSLSHNRLIRLPASLGDLMNLKTLVLAHNRIEVIPASLAGLSNLLILDLTNNDLLGFPSSLRTSPGPGTAPLASLQELYLNGNAILRVPGTISELTTLRTLSLFACSLESVDGALGTLPILENLNLERNDLTSLPDALAGLHTVDGLRLGENRLCNVSQIIRNWAGARDPDWAQSQSCQP